MSKPFKTKVPGTSCKPAYTKNQAPRPSRPGFQFGRGLHSWWLFLSRCNCQQKTPSCLCHRKTTSVPQQSQDVVYSTFKLCCHPFTQLWTIDANVKSKDHVKQVPLVFVLMSGKKTKYYQKVNMDRYGGVSNRF